MNTEHIKSNPIQMEHVVMNTLPFFRYASRPFNEGGLLGYARVAAAGEHFWLRECKQIAENLFEGVVENNPILTADHGIRQNDTVRFRPANP